MGTIIGEGITFDDVLLVPAYSKVIPNQVDVSVPPVRLINLWIQLMIVCRNTLGFPIRKSPVITVHITLPTLIAD